MKNPFSLSDDKLTVLLNAYSSWSQSNEQEKTYAEKEKGKREEIKNTLLSNAYLADTSDQELTKKILAYSRTLEGPAFIRLGMDRVTNETEAVKKALIYLLDSADDPFEKAEKILAGEYKIPIFGKAFWSPILQARYPDDLPNWNNKTENFFKSIGVNLQTSKLSIKEKYKTISDAFLYLKSLDPKQDFYTLNHLMHFGTAIEKGRSLIENLKKNGELPTEVEAEEPGGGGFSELCLLGTAGDADNVVGEQAFLEEHGAWASWWSFPIRSEAQQRLKLPFYLYINAGGGKFPYRFVVEDYKTSQGNEGIVSPWPEFTEEENKDKVNAGDKLCQRKVEMSYP